MATSSNGALDEATNSGGNSGSNSDNSGNGWSDDQFQAWIAKELIHSSGPRLVQDYPSLFVYDAVPRCITNWRKRFRGNPALWKRLFHKDKVVKEFIEAIPVLDTVLTYTQQQQQQQDTNNTKTNPKKITILDLCSGKGYLSMLLSEMLDPKIVEKIVLIDKAWPMHNVTPQSHHINWDHIYGKKPQSSEGGGGGGENGTSYNYFDKWPIPLHTSKQDLKHPNNLRNIQRVFIDASSGPVIMLAIHLCGTLSLRAIDLYNRSPKIQLFGLKPCCLPGMVHAKRHEIFQLGNHSFDSKLVCMRGKWKGNKWVNGPPRSHLQSQFQTWSENLYLGILDDDNNGEGDDGNDNDFKRCRLVTTTTTKTSTTTTPSLTPTEEETNNGDQQPMIKTKLTIQVQQGGGYQNDFLFAQRGGGGAGVWHTSHKSNEQQQRQ